MQTTNEQNRCCFSKSRSSSGLVTQSGLMKWCQIIITTVNKSGLCVYWLARTGSVAFPLQLSLFLHRGSANRKLVWAVSHFKFQLFWIAFCETHTPEKKQIRLLNYMMKESENKYYKLAPARVWLFHFDKPNICGCDTRKWKSPHEKIENVLCSAPFCVSL